MVTAIYFGGVLGTAIYAMLFTFATANAGGIVAFTDLDSATFQYGFHITMAARAGTFDNPARTLGSCTGSEENRVNPEDTQKWECEKKRL